MKISEIPITCVSLSDGQRLSKEMKVPGLKNLQLEEERETQ